MSIEWVPCPHMPGLFMEDITGDPDYVDDDLGGVIIGSAYKRTPFHTLHMDGIVRFAVDDTPISVYPWVPLPDDAPSTCYDCGSSADEWGHSFHVYCIDGECWCPCWLCAGTEEQDPEGEQSVHNLYYAMANGVLLDLIDNRIPQTIGPPLPGRQPTSTFGLLFQAFLYR